MVATKHCWQCKHFRSGKPADQIAWPPRMGHCSGAHLSTEIHHLARACPEYSGKPLYPCLQLRRCRQAQDLSRYELGQLCGVKLAKIVALELGTKLPHRARHKGWIPAALKLASFFGCPVEELFPHYARSVRFNRRAHYATYQAVVDSCLNMADMSQPDQCLQLKESRQALHESLKVACSVKEILVLGYRFGLDGGGRRTLDQIGRMLGIHSRQRVQQIEARALKNLRSYVPFSAGCK